ncbi:hypothetical protein KOW79_022505 [Hemibagrus wyckioides]|uniref:Uncharacterized protein n=1 Tax=Hemibagrus wyckioides TaxID=337641 RepID=A0A9D3N386_9TELE|nr:hypothetical protein KOW79_022505 [Hemibagrus wyckioides]
MTALYVCDLDPKVTESMIVEKFSSAGHVHSVRLCRDRKTGSSLGYAFVNFKHRADAERAVKMLNSQPLMKRPMRVMWSVRNSCVGKLIVKNLDWSIDDTALFDAFSVFGKILSCKVATNEKGSKGFGFVQFETEEAANRAMKKLNGKLLHKRKVFIELFKPREERRAEEQNPKLVNAGQAQTKQEEQTQHNNKNKQIIPLGTDVELVGSAAWSAEVSWACFGDGSKCSVPASSQDVPTYLPAGKRLTIYILESAALEDQIQMAHDYLLPLVEKIHPTQANQITWMLVQAENNYNIMDMIGDPELLRAKVDKMDRLLKAREAGVKPEKLKMLFGDLSKKKRRKKRKNK